MRRQWKGGSLIVRRFTWARDSSATPGSPGCGISRGTPGGRPCSPTVEDRNPWRRLGSLESPTPVSSSRFCTPGTCSAASIWNIKQRCCLSLRHYSQILLTTNVVRMTDLRFLLQICTKIYRTLSIKRSKRPIFKLQICKDQFSSCKFVKKLIELLIKFRVTFRGFTILQRFE